MTKIDIKAFARLLLAFFCTLSYLLTPSMVRAEECNEQQNSCCQQADACCDSDGWGRTVLIGGTIIAGGIAGVIACNANRGRHHHHSSGSTGATGPTGPATIGATGPTGGSPFIVEKGTILSFHIPLNGLVLSFDPTTTTGPVSAISFVSTPTGVVIDGSSSITTIDVGGLVTFTSELIVTVQAGEVTFGTYTPGVHINTSNVNTTAPSTTYVVQTAPLTSPFVEIFLSGSIIADEVVVLGELVTPPTGAAIPVTSDLQIETQYTHNPETPNQINP